VLGSVRHSKVLAFSAPRVWEIIGDPADLAKWIPDFASCSVEGTTRTLTTKSGLTFDEELHVVDPVTRRIQYELKLPIARFHRGTLDVVATGENSCVVSYATECDPRIMALVIGAPTYRGLVELERQLNEGE